ncbi:hypothetical protein IMZ68_00960 [Candidatus Bathyarchaeota archaeon]|nr:hypothetical protein [Candidatus Bathyarchaeota archaeon]
MKKTIAQLLRIFGVNKTIKDYENMKNTDSKPSIIQMIGEEIAKNASVEEMCPICKKKLELNYDNEGFYFACSDKVHKEHYKIGTDAVKNAVTSLKIKCLKCVSGQMILQYARESRPFLGCTQYRKLDCQSKLGLQDKYY